MRKWRAALRKSFDELCPKTAFVEIDLGLPVGWELSEKKRVRVYDPSDLHQTLTYFADELKVSGDHTRVGMCE
jgi:hypothetical protein